MKKTLTILGVIIVVGAGLYAPYWGDTKDEWRQHLPTTEIAVSGRREGIPPVRADESTPRPHVTPSIAKWW